MFADQLGDGLLVIGWQHHTLGFDPFQVQCHAHSGTEGTVVVVIKLHRSPPHRVKGDDRSNRFRFCPSTANRREGTAAWVREPPRSSQTTIPAIAPTPGLFSLSRKQ